MLMLDALAEHGDGGVDIYKVRELLLSPFYVGAVTEFTPKTHWPVLNCKCIFYAFFIFIKATSTIA